MRQVTSTTNNNEHNAILHNIETDKVLLRILDKSIIT